MDYSSLVEQRYELTKTPELWQFDLMNPQQFYQYAKDRGVSIFDSSTINKLWHVGLLRADLIRATRKLEKPSFDLASEENGFFIYCDKRQLENREQGFGGVFKEESEFDDIELLFHPFRMYMLYHIARVFKLHISAMQYLSNPSGFDFLIRHHIDFLNKWSAEKQSTDRLEHWNRTTELAIVLEPTSYAAVFQGLHWRYPDSEDTVWAKLQERNDKVRQFISAVPEGYIKDIRAELCRDAEILDQNKILHVVIRLMSRQERLKLRGSLGGCMQFLYMSEIIRRAAEDAWGRDLPEEDELGFGQWINGARKLYYGTERILDSSIVTRRQLMTSLGLDYGVQVRCYVEGATEFGAMTSAVGEFGGIEFINLQGRFVERGKGLGFTASLKNDLKSHIFSIVVLDQDRDDNIRALKRAVTSDVFFGRFFILTPDFEFANFTVEEMLDVSLNLAGRDRVDVPVRDDILPAIAVVKSSTEFFQVLKQNGLSEINKGESWGAALMSYALLHPEWPQGHKKVGETRPIIEIARFVVNARSGGYIRTIETFKVDPDTGELLKKDGNNEPNCES